MILDYLGKCKQHYIKSHVKNDLKFKKIFNDPP